MGPHLAAPGDDALDGPPGGALAPDGEVPPQAGNYHPVGVPTGVFKCRDGSIIIQAAGNRLYQRLCEVIEAPELLEDERFSTTPARQSHREEMTVELEKRC